MIQRLKEMDFLKIQKCTHREYKASYFCLERKLIVLNEIKQGSGRLERIKDINSFG